MRVRRLIVHLKAGGRVPPVVVATYAGAALPLDGHHRLTAAHELGMELDAWVVSGGAFDRLCTQVEDAEAHVFCGGVPAANVAGGEP